MQLRIVLGVWLGAGLALAGCESAQDGAPGSGNDDSYVAATAHTHVDDAPTATPVATTPPARELAERSLAYGEAADSNLIGYLALPADALDPLPGIVLVHEWWGLNDNIEAAARRLAGEGFVVLAVDLYAGATATTPADAERLMTSVMETPEATLGNIRQAYDYLEKYALAPRVAVLGWCLGGTWALRTALALPDELDALVMYYGQVITDEAQLTTLNMPILGLFAELDESIPVRDVQTFRARLSDLGKESTVFIYSDVGHAFANPSGGSYDAMAAEDAWQKTVEFLNAHLL